MILLDTDTVSELLKGNRKVFDMISQLLDEEWGISAQVAYELQRGALAVPESKRAKLVTEFLRSVQIMSFDFSAASAAAAVSADLKAKGKPIGSGDELIAGHAISMNAVLVTNNSKHMRQVAGLKLANWVK